MRIWPIFDGAVDVCAALAAIWSWRSVRAGHGLRKTHFNVCSSMLRVMFTVRFGYGWKAYKGSECFCSEGFGAGFGRGQLGLTYFCGGPAEVQEALPASTRASFGTLVDCAGGRKRKRCRLTPAPIDMCLAARIHRETSGQCQMVLCGQAYAWQP